MVMMMIVCIGYENDDDEVDYLTFYHHHDDQSYNNYLLDYFLFINSLRCSQPSSTSSPKVLTNSDDIDKDETSIITIIINNSISIKLSSSFISICVMDG